MLYIYIPHAVSHSCEIQLGHQIHQILSVQTLTNLLQSALLASPTTAPAITPAITADTASPAIIPPAIIPPAIILGSLPTPSASVVVLQITANSASMHPNEELPDYGNEPGIPGFGGGPTSLETLAHLAPTRGRCTCIEAG